MKKAGKKSGLGILMAGVTVMGVLVGWIAYAGEIETDAAATAAAVSATTNNILPLDPSAVQLITQTGEAVQAIQNNAITQDLFGGSTNTNGMAPSDVVLTNHFSNYCGPLEGECMLALTDSLFWNGDMKISSILYGAAYDANRLQAAQVFLQNLIYPPAAPGVTNFNTNMPVNVATLANGSPQTKAAFVQAISDEALMSIIREPFANMIAVRTPPLASGSNPAGPSQMQIMQDTAMERAMSSTWAASMNAPTTTPQQIMAQQAIMQAFQVWQAHQNYLQMERVQALLSVLALQNFRQQKAASAQVNQAQNASASSTSPSSSGQ
jgi:hypothetical protein